jgi:carboxylate-amine ligase
MVGGDGLPPFGVEEEFLLVDPITRALSDRAADVLRSARVDLGERVTGEITTTQVETRTTVCQSNDELYEQLLDGRRRLAAAAREHGLTVVASGTPVLGAMVGAPITAGERSDRGTAMYRGLHDDLAICALHVHVELPDRDRAVLVGNHLRPYLPALLALAANSPFWAERDTGYASWRCVIWERWPVAGPPPYVTSAAEYDELVTMALAVGALVDRATIFWDVRPSAHLPTLEVRVCDVATTARESTVLAALIRGLVVCLDEAVTAGDPGPLLRPELLRLAYWRAARDGMSGPGVDPRTGDLVPAAELAERIWRVAQPTLPEGARLRGWFDDMVGADGATHQRAAAARGSLAAVVDDLVARTVAD